MALLQRLHLPRGPTACSASRRASGEHQRHPIPQQQQQRRSIVAAAASSSSTSELNAGASSPSSPSPSSSSPSPSSPSPPSPSKRSKVRAAASGPVYAAGVLEAGLVDLDDVASTTTNFDEERQALRRSFEQESSDSDVSLCFFSSFSLFRARVRCWCRSQHLIESNRCVKKSFAARASERERAEGFIFSKKKKELIFPEKKKSEKKKKKKRLATLLTRVQFLSRDTSASLLLSRSRSIPRLPCARDTETRRILEVAVAESLRRNRGGSASTLNAWRLGFFSFSLSFLLLQKPYPFFFSFLLSSNKKTKKRTKKNSPEARPTPRLPLHRRHPHPHQQPSGGGGAPSRRGRRRRRRRPLRRSLSLPSPSTLTPLPLPLPPLRSRRGAEGGSPALSLPPRKASRAALSQQQQHWLRLRG